MPRFDKDPSRTLGRDRSPKPNRLLARTFCADRHAPGSARRALVDLDDKLDSELVDDVRLLVSELVTNSVRHTGSAKIDLEVWRSEDVLHVDVCDHGDGFDVSSPPQPGDASGWGLFMVDRLADRWGIKTNGGTRVWFEMLRPGPGTQRRDLFEPAS